MSWQAVEAVMQQSNTTGTDRMVLMVIATFAEKDDLSCSVGIEKLCQMANLKRRTLQYAIERLHASGELEIHTGHGRGNTNLFAITLPEKGATDFTFSGGENVQPISRFEQIKRATERNKRCNPAQEKVQLNVENVQSSAENAQPIAPVPVTNKKPIKKPEYIPELPDWLPQETWSRWTQYRKEIKKPLVPSTVAAQITALGKFHDDGQEPDEVIQQSIEHGWQGLFALKNQGAQNGTHRQNGNVPSLSAKDQRSVANNRAADELERELLRKAGVIPS